MINEKLNLTPQEKTFLKEIVDHWKTYKTWYERAGFDSGPGQNISYEEKDASRILIKEGLITMKVMPALISEFPSSSTSVNFAGTTVNIPLPTPLKVPMNFDLLFKPTRKGLRTCFVEEL